MNLVTNQVAPLVDRADTVPVLVEQLPLVATAVRPSAGTIGAILLHELAFAPLIPGAVEPRAVLVVVAIVWTLSVAPVCVVVEVDFRVAFIRAAGIRVAVLFRSR